MVHGEKMTYSKEIQDVGQEKQIKTNLAPPPAGLSPHRSSLDLDAGTGWRKPPLTEGRGLKGRKKTHNGALGHTESLMAV